MGILRRSGQFEWDEELRRISKRIPVDVILTHPIYEIVGRVADEMGVRAYAVGGVVRDYFLQRHCTDLLRSWFPFRYDEGSGSVYCL